MSSYTFNGRAIGWYREALDDQSPKLAALIVSGEVPAAVVDTLDPEYAERVRGAIAESAAPPNPESK